jgi:H+-transporting ATPase
VSVRIKRYGYNEIPEKRVSSLVKFLRYFWGPIPVMIEIAVVLSAVIGHWEDFFIILALLFTNAIVGFYQERKAGNAVELLKEKLAPSARVLREHRWTELPARDIVPGDVVRVRLGDIVPADIKLFEGPYLEVDQSGLTGESLPVEKRAGEVGFSGSVVRKGETEGLVFATGPDTYFGKTARLVEEAATKSHFQRNIVKIGNFLIAVDAVLVAIIIVAAVIRHEGFLETLQFALVLTIAAIPVALPAVLSVTMAVGAIALAKKEAIVSKLVAIEEMASMDILCSDKTGTITKNALTTSNVIGYGVPMSEVLLAAVLASRAGEKDPIDDAIISGAAGKPEVQGRVNDFTVIDFTPFDPVTKRSEARVRGKEGEFTVTKGAPQVIWGLAENQADVKERMNRDVDAMAATGDRALGVARKEAGGWTLLGLIGLRDPPRDDSAQTVAQAERMGVEVKMVTGDHKSIAQEIAKEVGLGTDIVTAEEFLKVPPAEAAANVEGADGFAEVFPEHKYRIVELLQHENHIVGMTGDGVNDAPALKKADVGIAVEGSTDAAKSAAAIVLTRPGLSVVVDALVESRKIFQRMINYSIYRISETIRVLFFITLSIVIFQFYPVTALMIVLLALLNDLPILTIAYDNVRYSAMPEKWDMRILLIIALFLGTIGVVSSFLILYIGLEVLHLNLIVLQSFIYLKLSVAGHLTVLVARTKGPFWSVRPAWPLLAAIIGTQAVATIITVYGILLPAMGWALAGLVWGYAFLFFVLTDRLKVSLYKYLMKKGEVNKGLSAHAAGPAGPH